MPVSLQIRTYAIFEKSKRILYLFLAMDIFVVIIYVAAAALTYCKSLSSSGYI